jgi:UPF0042 nucleotide-binding protein
LKELSGCDPRVRDYVLENPIAGEVLPKLRGFLDAALPHYMREGKSYFTLGVGCTGGRHRSVVVADELGSHIKSQGYSVAVHHRDINKK